MADNQCDHSACLEWSCKEWCQCYQEEFDSLYEAAGCNQDDGADGRTVCKCPRWGQVVSEHETCALIDELEDEAARREGCEHMDHPHCAWREADKTCAATAVDAAFVKLAAPARCTKWCVDGKACGSSCINRDYVCGGADTPTPENEGASNPGSACDTSMYIQPQE